MKLGNLKLYFLIFFAICSATAPAAIRFVKPDSSIAILFEKDGIVALRDCAGVGNTLTSDLINCSPVGPDSRIQSEIFFTNLLLLTGFGLDYSNPQAESQLTKKIVELRNLHVSASDVDGRLTIFKRIYNLQSLKNKINYVRQDIKTALQPETENVIFLSKDETATVSNVWRLVMDSLTYIWLDPPNSFYKVPAEPAVYDFRKDVAYPLKRYDPCGLGWKQLFINSSFYQYKKVIPHLYPTPDTVELGALYPKGFSFYNSSFKINSSSYFTNWFSPYGQEPQEFSFFVSNVITTELRSDLTGYSNYQRTSTLAQVVFKKINNERALYSVTYRDTGQTSGSYRTACYRQGASDLSDIETVFRDFFGDQKGTKRNNL